MIIILSKWTVLLFGRSSFELGFIMFFAPKKARAPLWKVGSTNFMSNMEITSCLIAAIALIICAGFCKFSIM